MMSLSEESSSHAGEARGENVPLATVTDSSGGPSLIAQPKDRDEQIRRWRLVMGGSSSDSQAGSTGQEAAPRSYQEPGEPGEQEGDEDAVSAGGEGEGAAEQENADGLSEADQAMDDALNELYGSGNRGGRAPAAPDVARWLADVNRHFPEAVVEILHHEALQERRFRTLLTQPDFLAQVQPDVALAGKLLALSRLMPDDSKAAAREVVRQVVEELMEHLAYPLHQALAGSINRSLRARRPRRLRDVNWMQTIRANLKHYRPELGTVVPEHLYAYGRQRASLRDVILCLDQSSSMGSSVVYAGIYGSIMASLPALSTRLVAFSSTVTDLTDQLSDPVDLLFGIQLRGGTNIERALAYCHTQVIRPLDTVMVLLTDLYEGGNREQLVRRAAAIKADGVELIVLLALDDRGAPRFNRSIAQQLAELEIPVFACTPEQFPGLMGAAVNGLDIKEWAASAGIAVAPRN